MIYLLVQVVPPVLEVLVLHRILGVQGLLGGPQSHLLPGGLTDPADQETQCPCPPVTKNIRVVNQHS